MVTDDLISRLTAAIDAKEAKARAADWKVYGAEDKKVTAPGSLSWISDTEDGSYSWVRDEAWDNVALASDVDMSNETWEPMTPGRVEFIVDNDPESVLRGCAADRKVLAIHQPIKTFAGSEDFLPKHAGTPEFPIKVICERCANHDQESGWDDYDEDTRYPCETLRAVAERYGLEMDGE